MKNTIKTAFIDTVPVLTGYFVLGFGFGLVLKSAGYGILVTFVMSLLNIIRTECSAPAPDKFGGALLYEDDL